jgi:Concanavalin A-like lectin/glucanases superfamily
MRNETVHHIQSTGRLAFFGLLITLTAAACGGAESDEDTPSAKGGSGGKATGGSGGKATGGSGGKATGGSGGKATGGSEAGGTGGRTTGGSAGSAPGGTGGTIAVGGLPSNGLIGYWKFDEGSGSKIADGSTAKNDGAVLEGASSDAAVHPSPTWGAGKYGKALAIDGLNDWVRMGDSDSLDSTGVNNSVSVSIWIKLNKYNTLKPFNVIAQRHELGTRVEQFMLGMFNGAPTGVIHHFIGTSVVNTPLNEWVHMAMTYNGISQIIYMNGAMVSSQDVGWPIATDETPFTIGAGINENDVIEQIDGWVDEARLYNVELTSGDIDALAKQIN